MATNPYELSEIIFPSLLIFILTFCISFSLTKWICISIIASFIKSGIFLIYYGIFFDGAYTFLDDWTYIAGGYEFLKGDIGITNLHENWEKALFIGQGDHFVYYLYNAYAIKFFGGGYYSPVALNIFLTVGIAYFGSMLSRVEFNLTQYGSKVFYIFILLHPDILAWSNIMNGKDILVLFLHVLFLISFSQFFRGHLYLSFLIGGITFILLIFLRFYVPVLFSIAFVGGRLLNRKGGRLGAVYYLLPLIFGALYLLSDSILEYSINSLAENWVNPFYGFIRMLLTPIPFATDDAYAFLNIPALLHWLLMPFLFLGVKRVWNIDGIFPKFFISYFLIFMALYAAYGELQGPRHRVQLDFAFATFQFLGLIAYMKKIKLSLSFESSKRLNIFSRFIHD